MKKHFFIFVGLVFCAVFGVPAFGVSCSCDALIKWKSGNIDDFLQCSSIKCGEDTYTSPLEVAISGKARGTGFHGNYDAVKAILENKPELAKKDNSIWKRPILQQVIENCCVPDNKNGYGKNRTGEIANLLIDKNPEVLNYYFFDSAVRYQTLLDYVISWKNSYDDDCRRTGGTRECEVIEKLLKEKGAKTCADSQCESASRSVTYTVDGKTFDTMEAVEKYWQTGENATTPTVVASTSETLVATDTQNTKKKKWFQGEHLRAFYEEAGLSGSAKQESDKALNAWKQNCLTEGISTKAHVRKTEVKKDPSHKTRYIELIKKEKNNGSDNYSYYDAELDFLNSFNGTVWGCRVAECDPGYKEAETVISYPFCEEDKSSSTAPAATGTTATETATPDDNTKSGDTDTKTSSVSISDAQGNQGNKTDTRSEEEKRKALAEKQKAYDAAKETEQSTENKLLGGLTTAATGIGGMQALQGLAEQSSDKDAEADMAAYIETMRCTYGDGKQVKAGPDEIELPGANDAELMKLRAEYLALAADLKERKEALGMKPGIESELIMDRTQTGLYDDENVGITSGNYASLYRAMMLGSEKDQAKIDDAAKTSANRVKYGAIAAGAGVVGGIVGNSLINGKLGELIKEKNAGKSLKAAAKIESDALKDIQKCLKDAGVKDTDKLEFKNFYPSVLSVKNINCKTEIKKIGSYLATNVYATSIFEDSTDVDKVYDKLITSFGSAVTGKMIGVTLNSVSPTNKEKKTAKESLKKEFEKVEKRFIDAAKEDAQRQSKDGNKTNFDFGSLFGGENKSTDIMGLVSGGLGSVATK